jgi:hypothetical protein
LAGATGLCDGIAQSEAQRALKARAVQVVHRRGADTFGAVRSVRQFDAHTPGRAGILAHGHLRSFSLFSRLNPTLIAMLFFALSASGASCCGINQPMLYDAAAPTTPDPPQAAHGGGSASVDISPLATRRGAD